MCTCACACPCALSRESTVRDTRCGQLLRGPAAVAVVVLHERNGAEELARVGVSFAAEEVVREAVRLHVWLGLGLGLGLANP